MKFKTRLKVTFAVIVLVPIILMTFAFMLIGATLLRSQRISGFGDVDYATMSDGGQAVGLQTQLLYEELSEKLEDSPFIFEDEAFLDSVSADMGRKNSYILVRKDGEIFYTGNKIAAEQIIDKLPEYGQDNPESSSGYYFYILL